jgi:hypothetical protein
MSNFLGYPFLISRNYNIDYRLVYAPPFCKSPKIAGLLINATGNVVEDFSREFFIATLDLPSSNFPSRLLYRAIPAKGCDIGDNTVNEITDNVGRSIYHIEGILIDKNINLSASSIDGERFFHLVHVPLMLHFREFWNQIPIDHRTESELIVPLQTLLNSEIIEVKDIHQENSTYRLPVQKKITHLKSYRRTFQYLVGLSLILITIALYLSFHSNQKERRLDAKITDIFQRKYNSVSIKNKLTELEKLTTNYTQRNRGRNRINCILLNRIIENRAYRNTQKWLYGEDLIVFQNRYMGIVSDHTSCKRKMRNVIYDAKQRLQFLRN